MEEGEKQIPSDQVRIVAWAEVAAWRKLDSLAVVQRLRGYHIWRDEVIASRFQWGREQAVYVLLLRVHRLAQPWTGALLPDYGGCKSWIELGVDVPLIPSTPVIADVEFRAIQERILGCLDAA
jgi:hypothetical protein